jgi:hypothetical protein
VRRVAAAIRRWLSTVALAGAMWGPEERVTTTTTDSETGFGHHPMVVDAAGTLHLAWSEQDGVRGNYQVRLARRAPGGAWSAPELVVPFRPEGVGSLLGAKYPSLAVGPGDTIHVAWHDYRHGGIQNCEIYYKAAAATAAWDTSAASETRLTTTNHPETNGDNGYVPTLLADDDGTLHVTWYDFRFDGSAADIFTKSRRNGGWDTTPGDAADPRVAETPGDSQFPDAALDPWGGLHVVWQDDTAGNWRILYARRPFRAPEFEAPVALTEHAFAATSPVVAIDGTGRVVVAWADAREGSRRIRARYRESNGPWSPDRPASPPGFAADEPALAVDGFGRAWLAWHDTRYGATNREILVQCAAAGADFDSTGAADVRVSNATGNSTRPSLLSDPAGARLFVAWRDRRDGNHELYLREAVLAAPVGVPDEAPRPPAALLAAWPNPFRDRVTIEWTDAPGAAGHDTTPRRFDVFDAAGRRRATVALPPGASTLDWTARGEDGTTLPAGVYVLKPRGAPDAAPRRIVRIP